jgi:hypothetical protein
VNVRSSSAAVSINMSTPSTPTRTIESTPFTPASSNPGAGPLPGTVTSLFDSPAAASTADRNNREMERNRTATAATEADDDEKRTEKKLKRISELAKMGTFLPEAQKFSGEGQQPVRQWLTKREFSLFQLAESNKERAFIGIQWLTGVAEQIIMNEVMRRRSEGMEEMGWDDIRKTLIETFDIGNTSETALQHLATLKMSANNINRVAAYNNEWYKQLQYIDVAEWNTMSMTNTYIRGLWNRIRMKMIETKHASRRANPSAAEPTLALLMREALGVEAAFREMEQLGPSYQSTVGDRRGNRSAPHTASTNSTSAPATAVRLPVSIRVNNITDTVQEGEIEGEQHQEDTEGAPHSLSAVTPLRGTSNNSASSSVNKKVNTVFLNEEDRTKLSKAGRCFRCYKKGHLKAACTEPAATQKPDFARLN